MPEGRMRRALRRLTADIDEIEAEQLQERVRDLGCVSIADAPSRTPVRLAGTVETVTLRPRAGVPALEADLTDGSGTVVVVWLGRRKIAGVVPGISMVVEGRIGLNNGRPTIFNPRYELLAPRS